MSKMTRADRRGGDSSSREEPAADESSSGTSLESFVAQLHDEGVEAGRREAAQLVRRAEEEAAELLRRAEAEADALLEEARTRAADERARDRAELELAARDAVLALQAALSDVLRSILARAAESRLADPDVVASLLKEVVRAYAQADAAGRPTEVRVPRSLGDALEAWWVRELAAGIAGNGAAPVLSATLEEAGFEYRVGDGTVEVSVDSVVETLMGLARPALRELVAGTALPGRTIPTEARPASTGKARGRGRRGG
jgi:vacuolar-type H+-ATPase subunit E/Vma4